MKIYRKKHFEEISKWTQLDLLKLECNGQLDSPLIGELGKLPDLTNLVLCHHWKIDAASVSAMNEWPGFRTLELQYAAGDLWDRLPNFLALSNLETLNLQYSNPTDQQLKVIAENAGENLLHLKIISNKTTDAGILQLGSLTHLKSLNVSQSPKLSETGIAALQEKLPGCKIVR